MSSDRVRPSRCCEDCGKQVFRTRKEARAAGKKNHPGEHMIAYECDRKGSGLWHYGHDHQWRFKATADPVTPATPAACAQIAAVARATLGKT